jgi:predicted PurR-regulated permease PerM
MSPSSSNTAPARAAAVHRLSATPGIKVRNGPLLLLTAMVGIWFLDWAEALLLPLVVSILLSYALDPLITPLDRFLPRPLSAALLLLALVGLLGAAVLPMQRETMAMLDKVPLAISRLQRAPPAVKEEEGVLAKAQEAAEQIEQAASEQVGERRPQRGVSRVQIVEPPFDLRRWLITGTSGALVLGSQMFSVVFLVYFLLATGKLYRRKVVSMAGPTFQQRREMLVVLMEFHQQVRRFLFVTLLGAIFVGALSWLLFMALGLQEAIFWGVVAGIASAVPYLGPLIVLIGTAMAAFVQFGSVEMTLLVAGGGLVITSIQGYVLLPVLTAQVSSLNTVAIFVGLLFWGWLWGVVGLVVATPLLMMVKTICDHVRGFRHIGELLGK